MKFKEIVYIVNDLCKQYSDDTDLTEEHILFLLTKYRGALLQQYSNIKKFLPESNYQTIDLELERVEGLPCIAGAKLRSKEPVPHILPIGNPSVFPFDYYIGDITLISKERMKYVGYNKALGHQIYCSIAPDHHLYFKSCDPQMLYLLRVKMNAVFEDVTDAAKLTDNEEGYCDIMEMEFPLESSLIPNLIQQVLRDILGASYRPSDKTNNAQDDLAQIASFIQRNVKSPLAKQIDGE